MTKGHTQTVTIDHVRTLAEADNPAADVARFILEVEEGGGERQAVPASGRGETETPAD